MEEFIKAPRVGEVYNIGGGKENTCSIWEAFEMIEKLSGKKMIYDYTDENRIGDHICYYSDLSKMRAHFPGWDITRSLEQIFREVYEGWQNREA